MGVNLQNFFASIPKKTSLNDIETPLPEAAEEFFRNHEASKVVENLPKVCPMSPEMIPTPLRDWITDTADRMEVPIDFIAVPAIIAIASLIGTRCTIRPKQYDDFSVTPNLYGGLIANPSQLKSAAMNEAFRPISRLAAQARQDFLEKEKEYMREKTIYEANRKKLEKKLNNGKITDDEYRTQLKLLQEEDPKKPTEKRFLTDDSTVEKLMTLLQENPQGLLVKRDELEGLFRSFQKTGREEDRSFYLTAWNGNQDYYKDRVGSGSLYVPIVCISLFGTTQPDKMIKLLNNSKWGNNDGLVQRFQLLVYPDPVQRTGRVDKRVNKEAKNKAYDLYEKIANVEFGKLGAVTSAFGSTPYFRFHENLQEGYFDWAEGLEKKLVIPDLSSLLQEHLGKYRSLLPALALIFHVIELIDRNSFGPISHTAFNLAVTWCEYLEKHAYRIYEGLGKSQQGAIELSKKIKKKDLPTPFTLRDVQRKNFSVLERDKNAIQQSIDRLCELNWLYEHEPEISGTSGRRPALQYFVNPEVFN